MPLPKPKTGESKDDFLDRCMGDDKMNSEYPDSDQRYAVCNSLWDQEDKSMDKHEAIGAHHTATSSRAWDGPKAEKNLKSDGDEAYYRKAFAWQDPGRDPATKSAYRFMHHEVSPAGDIGAASVKGCQAAIGVLNGATGGAHIPEDERQSAYDHIAMHLRDAGVEPAELKCFVKMERRSYPLCDIEVTREMGDKGETVKIRGHAAVFNKLSEDLGGFREKIDPGAFAKTIKSADVRALFNHESNYVLGRTKAGTLALEEDERGLYIEIDPPDTQWARDLQVSIRRKDIDQMSFGFLVRKEAWDKENSVRTLIEVDLIDVSPVTFPAYPQTDVKVRSALQKAGIDFEKLGGAIARCQAKTQTEEDTALIGVSIDILRGCLPQTATGSAPAEEYDRWLSKRRRELKLLDVS